MYSLRIISPTAPTTQQVTDFKNYIGQSGAAADIYLAAILQEAMIHVGEWHDRSLMTATYQMDITEREDTYPIRLYVTPKNVTSVTDDDGNSVPFTHTENGRYVTIDGRAETLHIVYTTQADTGAAATLMPKVWEYGKAKYEGRTMDAAQILMR